MKNKLLSLLILLALVRPAVAQQIVDYEGNLYDIHPIGTQVWMLSNLKTTHYYDGTPINGVYSYNNDVTISNTYGMLYTWSAAMRNSNYENTQGVCPDGWHLPEKAEWDTLINYFGGQNVAGGPLKEQGMFHWQTPNVGATETSVFNALPAGQFDVDNSTPYKAEGMFSFLYQAAKFWTSSENDAETAKYLTLSYDSASVISASNKKNMAYSIRCIEGSSSNLPAFNKTIKCNIGPSPTFGELNIEISENENLTNCTVKINNVLGENLLLSHISKNKCKFDISNFPTGIYFVQVQSGNNCIVKKIIKK